MHKFDDDVQLVHLLTRDPKCEIKYMQAIALQIIIDCTVNMMQHSFILYRMWPYSSFYVLMHEVYDGSSTPAAQESEM